MGAGSALEATIVIPEIAHMFAKWIDNKEIYHLVVDPSWPGPTSVCIGGIQSKTSYRLNSSLELVQDSLLALSRFAALHSEYRIDTVAPGIGLGNLSKRKVLEFAATVLPGNVHVWLSLAKDHPRTNG